ncbi:stage II sporulation protein E [Fervidibacillus halotolerans]|uniref:Stage II sporulation protein E n=1 Tax=Fervidibacillus halotolerans TaxID=2980027 RepID=A0A9E8LZC6_9BACI|nr:stage II sporulation protein E [Fervidibacillus halotolerans]WAA12351.1 stage II sporulation protein E [Fervidibacillus halotolerans]
MGKTSSFYMNPMQERSMVRYQGVMKEFVESFVRKLEYVFIYRGLLLFLLGFMLGRAFILSTLSPFSLPFFAAVYLIRKDRAHFAMIGLILGSLTISLYNALYTFLVIGLFLIFYRILKGVINNEIGIFPYYVFISIFMGRTFLHILENGDMSIYFLLLGGIEAVLSFVLTIIFLQSIPILSTLKKHQSLRTEELVCLIILLASVMTGIIDWKIMDLSMANIFARYFVILFAFAAGATVGSTVGVVTGLIFGLANVESLSELSLLAFAGLLGGLLKEGKKLGVSLGLFIATLLIGIYGTTEAPLTNNLLESSVAFLFLLLTPRTLSERIAKNIPGTPEFTAEQQAYMKKIRDVTAQKVNQYSSIFRAISASFAKQNEQMETEREREIDYFLSNVTEKTCQTCFKKEQCWVQQFNKTYDSMKQIMTELNEQETLSNKTIKNWKDHCVRSKRVIDAIQEELYFYQSNEKLKRQMKESRKLVVDQLEGVSQVMENFAKEIRREQENHEKQEEQLMNALLAIGLDIDDIEIYSLKSGEVDIDIRFPYCDGMGQCEKIIAPLLSDILGETIVVHRETCAQFPQGTCLATFRSSKAFVVETGVVYAAKDGGFVSGDGYEMMELDSAKFALAISDGMGNGERAHRESQETLSLLNKILQSGIGEEIAIKSINSILSLRTTEEIYSTLDLAIIDLQDAQAKFIKVGSMPSFIKRGNKVIKIQANNLPIGILHDFEVEVVNVQLMAEDLLIMISDGILEGKKPVENVDLWMKRKISQIETDDPQEVADLLLEDCIRSRGGQIEDDMTVLVAKIKHNLPKWTSIPAQSIRKWA